MYLSKINKRKRARTKVFQNKFVYLNLNRNFNNIVFLFQENSTINESESKVIITQTGAQLI